MRFLSLRPKRCRGVLSISLRSGIRTRTLSRFPLQEPAGRETFAFRGPICKKTLPIQPGRRICLRALSTSTSADESSTNIITKKDIDDSEYNLEPMCPSRLYQYLGLTNFSQDDIQQAYRRIQSTPIKSSNFSESKTNADNPSPTAAGIDEARVVAFLFDRIGIIDGDLSQAGVSNVRVLDETERFFYAQQEAQRFMKLFAADNGISSESNNKTTSIISEKEFVENVTDMATAVDWKRMYPITMSILLVGTSVGIVTPAMPFVVENIGLTPGQYGTVVSGFALAKMAGNIPSAILVERHGRKPYLTYSLAVIAMGVGGIGMAGSFEELYMCRLMTGLGVAALTTAAQLMVQDVSTPLNRATTMSPIMSAFAAGTALGPAFGGSLVDNIGLQSTFFMVGTSYLFVASLNKAILTETKRQPFYFPWKDEQHYNRKRRRASQKQQQNEETSENTAKHDKSDDESVSLATAAKDALAQWVPLFQNPKIRNVMIMNGFYWVALSGAQMTLLPLLLTSPSVGLNMTASGVGQVYMGMSLVQVMSNPIMAKYLVDQIGKTPAIAGGCTIIASSMTCLPLCTDNFPVFVGTLGMWALGSSMLSTAPISYISDLVPEDQRAQAIAMLRTSGDVGFLLGASGIGALADFTGGLDVAMQSSGGLLSAATLWFIVRQYLSKQESSIATLTSTNNGIETDKKDTTAFQKDHVKSD